ncbi:16584_t:CDS:1, partial [Dentiscutata heterogama]
ALSMECSSGGNTNVLRRTFRGSSVERRKLSIEVKAEGKAEKSLTLKEDHVKQEFEL